MTQEQTGVDIVAAARNNDNYRREVLTGEHEQVVVMTIPAGGEIGEEVHDDTDQVLVFVEGSGEAQLDGVSSRIGPNDLVFVHAGTRHNFLNTGDGPMRLYVIYAPAHHMPGKIHPSAFDATVDTHDEPAAWSVQPSGARTDEHG